MSAMPARSWRCRRFRPQHEKLALISNCSKYGALPTLRRPSRRSERGCRRFTCVRAHSSTPTTLGSTRSRSARGCRHFTLTLLGGAATWPLMARAQQAAARRIGVLMAVADDDPEAKAELAGFREGLARLGWVEGQTIHIDYRFAGGNPERFSVLAKELVALHSELIFA